MGNSSQTGYRNSAQALLGPGKRGSGASFWENPSSLDGVETSGEAPHPACLSGTFNWLEIPSILVCYKGDVVP